ncbi:MAG: hypothetical protein KGI37_10805 [Alphaproteobacteria bacterium]|nr:hypothetical protein [Alphaproteobacteria bacterium]
MRKSTTLFATGFLLASVAPALAGTLSFDNGRTVWHSTQCTEPSAPESVLNANPETSGDDMNALIGKHNAYVAAMQSYMNCLSDEAAHDQSAMSQAIVTGAKQMIADAQSKVDADAQALKNRQKQ